MSQVREFNEKLFKTAGQKLSEEFKGVKMVKKRGRGKERKKMGGRRGRTRQQRGRGRKTIGVAKRLFGDDPEYPATDYIAQRAFLLRKDKYNGYK